MEIKKEVRKKWATARLCGAARCSPVGAINTGYKLWFSSPPRHLPPIKPTIYDSHTNPKQPHWSNFFGRQIYRLARWLCTELCNIERRKTRCTDSWRDHNISPGTVVCTRWGRHHFSLRETHGMMVGGEEGGVWKYLKLKGSLCVTSFERSVYSNHLKLFSSMGTLPY